MSAKDNPMKVVFVVTLDSRAIASWIVAACVAAWVAYRVVHGV
jgi:hypothetical protein